MSGSEPNQGLWTEEESSTQTSQDDILKMEEDEDFDEQEIETTETHGFSKGTNSFHADSYKSI